MRKTVFISMLLGVITLLGFTVLAQAKYEDYFLQCAELNSCNLVRTGVGRSFVIKQYTTEPVLSCGDNFDNHSEILKPNCVVRLSVAR